VLARDSEAGLQQAEEIKRQLQAARPPQGRSG
jgi:hypothetical protein